MADYQALRARVQELAERDWDLPAIDARLKRLAAEGIPRKIHDREEMVAHKAQILERVQRRGEEYNLLACNCARGTALAALEELGLGSMEIVKALSPFPGFGGTGWMCGGVTGGLIALGLYFGSEDVLDQEAVGATMGAAQQFMTRFEEQVGFVLCPQIHEHVVFGRYMDPGASPENMEAFARAKGFEKCGLLPGIGARLAVEIVIESME
ncbi:MAG: C-GCAxxG-C-C family (seleno)protein [Anaerolineae bacterium]|jgi:C_GCAxxG_C_C family probable redox protein|nr:C-GCAxxG-C-C family (seleno)protein [Anaerolineae bacterium]MDX9828816.1 C-GCAxxG-C-C family (seleno)protein [Anaerolineae bacterium]